MLSLQIQVTARPPFYVKLSDDNSEIVSYQKIEEQSEFEVEYNLGEIHIFSIVQPNTSSVRFKNIPIRQIYHFSLYNMSDKEIISLTIQNGEIKI